MTLRIPKAAEEFMLDNILAVNYTLRLFTNDVESGLTAAQIEALAAGSFTEATFSGYASKALTGGAWVTTALDAPSTGVYAQQTYTRTVTGTAQTVRGYYVTVTGFGNLVWYEYFQPGPLIVTNNGDAIVVTPTFTLDDQEATVSARGIVARQSLTADSALFTIDATTDFVLNNVPTDSTRLYKVGWHSQVNLAAAGLWALDFYVGGVLTDRIATIQTTAGQRVPGMTETILWEPATGTLNIDLRLDEIVAAAADLTFEAAAARPRRFWVEDIGPR